jgi:signal transduction histidine kinase
MSSLAENRPGMPPNAPAPNRTSAAAGDAFGALIGGLTHDFNNLFGLIIGNLELLRDPQTTAEESQDFSRDALEAAVRGAELTGDLIAFAQRQRLDPRIIDLNALVTATVQARGQRLGPRVEIVLDLAHGLWPALADEAQLEAALATLMTNAAEAMNQSGRLRIVTANRKVQGDSDLAPGDYVMIALSDSGPAIPPEKIGTVFVPFASKGGGRGTGLRLGAFFGFLKQSRGHIAANSDASTGTTFTLYLPRGGAHESSRP